MVWPFRTKKPQRSRVAAEKTTAATRGKAPPARRLKHPLLTGLLLVGTVAVCTWLVLVGSPPLGYTVNFPSPRTVVALAEFRIEDPELTGKLRDNARAEVLNHYRRDPAVADRNREALKGALDRLFACETVAEANTLVGGEPLQLSENAWTELRQHSGSIRSGVNNILSWAHRGVMTREDLRRERLSSREGRSVIMLARGEGPFRKVNCDESILGLDRARTLMAQEFLRPLPHEATGAATRLAEYLAQVLEPDVAFLSERTRELKEAAAAAVPLQYREYKPGAIVVRQDQTVEEIDYRALHRHQQVLRDRRTLGDRIERAAGVAALIALVLAIVTMFLIGDAPRLIRNPSRLFFLVLGLVAMVAAAKLFVVIEKRYAVLTPLYWYPFALTPIILAVAYRRRFALGYIAVQGILVGMVFGERVDVVLPLVAGSVVGVYFTHDLRHRSRMAQVGLACGVTQCLVVWFIALASGLPSMLRTVVYATSALGNGLVIGLVVSGILPFIEKRFRVLTGIRLLEIADLNQPFLKSFALAAPGTYNHSVSVGTLAESTADDIGADGLLARVGGLFHDIGKINKPRYFIENVDHGASPHEGLSPSMSALIIKAHPKDGLEIARKLGLPEPIRDVIEEHHGTTMVAFFYKLAVEQAGDENPAPKEGDFRYPGRLPRSREAAIVMLADAVESATRTLDDPTPARIGHLVEKIIDQRLRDGQFDHCPITLRELAQVRKSLVKGLVAIYHSRVKY